MSYMGWQRERFIRHVLRGLARQRVVKILQPGNVWLVERALTVDDDTAAALRTCALRGWVEQVTNSAIPMGQAENLLNRGELVIDRADVIYRLTDSGWNVIHGNHSWVIATFIVAAAALVASIVSVLVGMQR
jgi:hypothetical protein